MKSRLFRLGNNWSLPLKGVRVKYFQEQENRLLISLETEGQDHVCPGCGATDVVGYGRMGWYIRDLPIEHKWVLLDISRRRLRCKACAITFNEPVAHICAAHRTTTRLAQRLWQLALYQPFATLAQQFGLDEKTLRNIFKDRFDLAMTQFRGQRYAQVPAVLVMHLPLIQRQKRLLWVNLDQGTVVDLNADIDPAQMAASLARLGVSATGAGAPALPAGLRSLQFWLPPCSHLITVLQAALVDTQRPWSICLHPWALRSYCHQLLVQLPLGSELPPESEWATSLSALMSANSASDATRCWQQLVKLGAAETNALWRRLATAVGILGPDCFAAFDHPANATDDLLAQLDNLLQVTLARRSFASLCVMLLCDKGLQLSARTGRASDGAHLRYQKAHYGTSLAKLVGKLTRAPAPV